MAKKKAQSNNKTQSLFITILVVVISVAILGASVIISSVGLFKDWAVKVNDDKITRKQYEFFLYQRKVIYDQILQPDWNLEENGSSYASDVKQEVLDELIMYKVYYHKATERNITLSEEDLAAVDTNVTQTLESMGEAALKKLGVTEDLVKQWFTEIAYGDPLYAEATKDYVFDEADFEKTFEEYFASNKVSLTTMTGDYIKTDTKEAADEAKAKLDSGTDFIEVMKEYSTGYDAESEAEYASAAISASSFPQEVVDAAYNTDEGDVTDIVESVSDGTSTFYIVKLVTKVAPDEAAVKTEQEEAYTKEKKDEIFKADYDTWSAEIKTEVNAIVIQTIDMAKLGGVYKPEESTESASETATETATDEAASESASESPSADADASESPSDTAATSEETTESESAE